MKRRIYPTNIRADLERKHPDAAVPKIQKNLACGHEQHVLASVDETSTRS